MVEVGTSAPELPPRSQPSPALLPSTSSAQSPPPRRKAHPPARANPWLQPRKPVRLASWQSHKETSTFSGASLPGGINGYINKTNWHFWPVPSHKFSQTAPREASTSRPEPGTVIRPSDGGCSTASLVVTYLGHRGHTAQDKAAQTPSHRFLSPLRVRQKQEGQFPAQHKVLS